MAVTGVILSQTDLQTNINAVIKNNPSTLIRGDVLAQILADTEKSSINNLTDYSANNSIVFKNNSGVITNLAVGIDRLIGRGSSGEIIAIVIGSGLSLVAGVLTASGGGGGIALTDLSAVAPLSYNSGTGAFTTSMATGKLIGRSTGGTGVMEEITVGSGLSLAAGVLTSSGGSVPSGTSAQTLRYDISGVLVANSILRNDGTDVLIGAGGAGTGRLLSTINSLTQHNIILKNTNSGGETVIEFQDSTGTELFDAGIAGTNYFIFSAAVTNGLIVDSIGNLGVTVTPSARTHIKGSTSDATAYALKVDNLAGGNVLHIRNDGVWTLGLNTATSIANMVATDINIHGSIGTTGQNRTAINANADGYYALAVGTACDTFGPATVAMGAFTHSYAQAGIAIGMNLEVTGVGGVMIGADYNTGVVHAIPRSFVLVLQGNSGSLHKQSFFVNYKGNVVLRSEDTITDGTHYDTYTTNTVTVHNGLAGTVVSVTTVTSAAGTVAQFNFSSNVTLLVGDPVVGSGFAVYTVLNAATYFIGTANLGSTSLSLYPTRADALAGSNPVLFSATDTGTITPSPRNPTANLVNAYQQYSADIVAGNAVPHFRTENGSLIKLYKEGAVTTLQGLATALTNIGLLTTSTLPVMTDAAEQNIVTAIAFIAGTAPATVVSNNYKWSQRGGKVFARFFLLYTTAGATVTGVSIVKPTDMPDPIAPSGWTGAAAIVAFGVGSANTGITGAATNSRGYMRRNAANTGWEFNIDCPSGAYKAFAITITYDA